MNRTMILTSIAGLLALAGAAAAQEATAPAGQCRAVLIGGSPGTPIHARQYRDWLTRMHTYLTKEAGVPAGNVTVLSGDEAFTGGIVNGESTRAEVLKALGEAAKATRAQDQLVVMMVGLGVPAAAGEAAKIVLPGPDVNATEIAEALRPAAAGNQVVLNFCSAAGDMTPKLSRRGRAVVSANMPMEKSPPVYAEFFLRALEQERADGEGAPIAGKKDGTVTLLEAYNWAAFQTAQWIARQTRMEDGSWKVVGKESVAIFRKLYVSKNGEAGSRTLSSGSEAGKPDPIVKLKFTDMKNPEIATSHRRIIAEHAGIQDVGKEQPISALGDEKKDYAPVDGIGLGEEGGLARRVVLGRPALLPKER